MWENIFSGIIGGLSVLIAERVLNRIEDRRLLSKGKARSQSNRSTLFTNDLLNALLPEVSYRKVEELIGIPDKTYEDESVFGGSGEIKFWSELYFFKNADVKITTVDKKSIHAFSIFSKDKNLKIPEIYYLCEGNYSRRLGRAKICSEILLHTSSSAPVHTIKDLSFALLSYWGSPFYRYVTYFCHDVYSEDEIDTEKYKDQLIEGFTISNGNDAFFIYEYEKR